MPAGSTGRTGSRFIKGALYVGDVRAIWRLPYKDGRRSRRRTRAGDRAGIVRLGRRPLDAQHRVRFQRAAVSSPSAAPRMWASIPCPMPRSRRVENGKLVTFASGLRNPVGVAFYPGTDNLFAVVNERDMLGDDLVPDYLTHVENGCVLRLAVRLYRAASRSRFRQAKRPDLVARAKVPDLLFQSHSAPLGSGVLRGHQFPAAYRGRRLRGAAWVVELVEAHRLQGGARAVQGRPAGRRLRRISPSASGARARERAQVWGRPAGFAVAKDGSLLIADDVANVVWRVSYPGH